MYSGAGGGDGSMFAGGGFMPSQSQANDFGGGGGRRSGSQNSGLLPLTAKMISQAIQKPSDENFYVDGVDVNNVCFFFLYGRKFSHISSYFPAPCTFENSMKIRVFLQCLVGR
jgi:hypothetical protein